MRKHTCVTGFTLIELLVVSAVTGVLAMLLLPTVYAARLQSYEQNCRNNLKQIAIALHNYHDVYSGFQPGWVAHHTDADTGPSFGWQTSLLPYVDQAPLYNQILSNRNTFAETDINLLRKPIAIYRCPAEADTPLNTLRGDFAISNYSGVNGNIALPRWAPGGVNAFWPGAVDTPQRANGVFWWNSRTRIRDMKDGTSNTIIVGERAVTSAAGIWPGTRANRFENDQVTDCSYGNELNSNVAAFSSNHHQHAVHFAMGDGSVRFIAASIDSRPGDGQAMGLYQKLSHKSDGSPVGEF